MKGMAPDRGTRSNVDRADARPNVAEEAFASRANQEDDLERRRSRSEPRATLALRASQPQSFTLRGVLVGLVIGVLVAFSNTYFGLQTGWISGMSMPSALIGFGFFKIISSRLTLPFSSVENVLIQTVASSVGTMPLGCGFVGVIPALEILLKPEEGGPMHIGFGKLCLWSVGICLFGVVFAVPLRKQVIIREKLKFPTGSATALMIGVLHGEKEDAMIVKEAQPTSNDPPRRVSVDVHSSSEDSEQEFRVELLRSMTPNPARGDEDSDWNAKARMLALAFGGSAIFTIVTYFIPQLRNVPIFGLHMANTWLWTLNPSPAYVGQGIIMGPATTMHMLFGSIIGWAVLSPMAKYKGWAAGPVSDWETGSKGWITWVSLAIMLADALVGLGWLILRPLILYSRRRGPKIWKHVRKGEWRELAARLNPASKSRGYKALVPAADENTTPPTLPKPRNDGLDNASTSSTTTSLSIPMLDDDEVEDDAPPSHQITPLSFLFWLVISLALYFVSIHLTFPSTSIPFSLFSLLLAAILSLMAVRALGETDLNPVTGISKLTQLILAVALPDNILLNLVAGGISEAGALQAGDLLQDLKTGHLLGASPAAQFHGQLIGSVFGALVSAAVYRLYTRVYEIPGPLFQMPAAYVWIFTARLVTGAGLPPYVAPFAVAFAAIWAFITALRIRFQILRARGRTQEPWWWSAVPGGIAVAVGMYNSPSFTLARAVGGGVSWWWVRWKGKGETGVVILASGLILGEGVCSIVNLALQSAGVPHL